MKKTSLILNVALLVVLVVSEFAVYNYAVNVGFNNAVISFTEALQQAGATVDITDLGNGSYQIHVHFPTASGESGTVSIPFELHMTVMHFRNGKLLSKTYHAMTLTDFGKNWIADKLSGASSTNFMANATYIGCSNSSQSVDTSWTSLPDEITTDGLARAKGSVTDTGTGTWNCTKTFSVTGTNSTKLYGYYLDASGNTLIAAEQQGTSNQKNLQNGDTLQITIQGSIS